MGRIESSGLGFRMRESHGREYDDFVSRRANAVRFRFVENDDTGLVFVRTFS